MTINESIRRQHSECLSYKRIPKFAFYGYEFPIEEVKMSFEQVSNLLKGGYNTCNIYGEIAECKKWEGDAELVRRLELFFRWNSVDHDKQLIALEGKTPHNSLMHYLYLLIEVEGEYIGFKTNKNYSLKTR